MPFSKLQLQLDERAALGLLRSRRTVSSPQAPQLVVDGKPYLSFCSNDYLGLASHRWGRVLSAMESARVRRIW
jgi:8-amino-7-oxononanoate synthase